MGVQKVENLNIFWNIQISIFSFVGGPMYIFLKHRQKSVFFSFVFVCGGLRTYHTYYNVSSYVLSNGDVNTSNSYQGMDPNHCLRGSNTKDWGSKKLKIVKSSETSKSAFFSFVGGPTYIFWKHVKRNQHFSPLCGGPRTYHTYYNVSSFVLWSWSVMSVCNLMKYLYYREQPYDCTIKWSWKKENNIFFRFYMQFEQAYVDRWWQSGVCTLLIGWYTMSVSQEWPILCDVWHVYWHEILLFKIRLAHNNSLLSIFY